jgi:hypothetical protein
MGASARTLEPNPPEPSLTAEHTATGKKEGHPTVALSH